VVSAFIIRKAALAIKQGAVIAYPTEAVFGLGCDPYQQAAVNRLLLLKHRPIEKGLILVASQLQQFDDFIEPLTDKQKQTIQASPHTSWVVPAKHAPFWLRGAHCSLAIRLSTHPLIVALCDSLDQPIVSTSANPSKQTPAKTSLQCHHYFHRELEIIINSETGSLAKPTEIRNLLTQQVIRTN